MASDCNLSGTLPEAISAWVDISTFDVDNNKITGPLPLSLSAWKKMNNFQVQGNQLSGGPLPAFTFPPTHICNLFNDYKNLTADMNQFTCPWPAGAVAACHVTDADCSKYSCDEETFQCVESRAGTLSAEACSDSCVGKTCTGNSTKLPQAQCEAWIDLYDSTGGDNWAGNAAACTRTDPCSCDTSVAPFTWRVCDPTNTMVQTM